MKMVLMLSSRKLKLVKMIVWLMGMIVMLLKMIVWLMILKAMCSLVSLNCVDYFNMGMMY